MLLARGIVVSHESIRRWGKKFGPDYARRLRRESPRPDDIWHLDEVVITVAGKKHWAESVSTSVSICVRGAHHSGNWGGLLADPAIILTHALATFCDRRGQIMLPEWRPDSLTDKVCTALKDLPGEVARGLGSMPIGARKA